MSAHPAAPISPQRMSQYSGDILRDTVISLTVIEVFAVVLRFTSLRVGKKSFGVDDFLAIPSFLCCLGLNIMFLVDIKLGRVGYHLDVVEALDPDALVVWAKTLVASPIIYSAACAFPRIMMLSLYLRIFGSRRAYRIACYIMMGFVIAFAIGDIVAGALQCIPIAYFWDKTIPDGRCFNITVFYRWGTLPNVIIDLAMLILPQPIVWKLQAPMHVKAGVAATFLTGSIGMITAICRCIAFFQNDPLADGTWKSVTYQVWSTTEPGIYLVAACLPCYRPLVRLALDRVRCLTASRYKSRKSNFPRMLGWSPMPNADRSRPAGTRQIFEMSTYDAHKMDHNEKYDERLPL